MVEKIKRVAGKPKTVAAKPSAAVKEKKIEGKEVGRVSGWFSHVSVAAIKLTAPLKIGDKIRIKGHTTDFEEKVASMQIENKAVKEAKKGDHIGIKVKDKVRPNDAVLLIK